MNYSAPETDRTTCEASGNKWISGYCWTPEEKAQKDKEFGRICPFMIESFVGGVLIMTAWKWFVNRRYGKGGCEK